MAEPKTEADKTVEALSAFLDATEAGIAQARRILGQQSKPLPAQKNPEYDPEKIKWEDRTGPKGPFQLASPTNNTNNPDFITAQHILQEAQTPLNGKDFMYWLMQDGVSIGRKPRRPRTEA